MKVPFVDLLADQLAIQDELLGAIEKVVRRADFVLGSDVDRFEEEFADYCGVGYAVGVDSGLSALSLLLEAFEIGAGDEVIVPANSFIATASAVTKVGARPVFVDIDPLTHNITIEGLEANITSKTRAVIPVHLYGLPVDIPRLMAVARKHHVVVIEDAAQAHGARLGGRRIGSFGDGAAFSFYPSKNLGAFGDAGMVVTSDKGVADRVRILRNCGQTSKYVHELTPHNHRLDTLQAAVLRIKLRHLDATNDARRDRARQYAVGLRAIGVEPATAIAGAEAAWHLFVIRSDRRDELRAYLQTQGIQTGIHYPIPIHLQPFYRSLGYERGSLPVAEAYAQEVLSLPMFPHLSPEATSYVVDRIATFVEQAGSEESYAAVGGNG